MSHKRGKRSAAEREQRVREAMFDRSPMMQMVADPDFVRSVAEWAWNEEQASGGAVSQWLDMNAPEVVGYLEQQSPGSTRAARTESLLDVPGASKHRTLGRLLLSSDGETALAGLFVRKLTEEHARLRAAGFSEERIAEGLSVLIPSLGDEQTWAHTFETLEPMVKEHNTLHEEVQFHEDILDRMAEGDRVPEPADPVAELEAKLAAETSDVERAKLTAELESARNIAKRDADRRAHGNGVLERKAAAAFDAVARREAELDVETDERTPARRAIARAMVSDLIDPETAAAAAMRVEGMHAARTPPARRFAHEDRLARAARAAMVVEEASAAAERFDLPPMLDDADRAAMRASSGPPPGGRRPTSRDEAPGARGLSEKVAKAYEWEAGVARATDDLRSEGRLPPSHEAPEPRGSEAHESQDPVREAVAAAYEKHAGAAGE